jgi:hypothetical protein
MDKNPKKSSPKLTSAAAKALQDKKTSAIGKRLAASVLSQASASKETGQEMEALASQVLRNEQSTEQEKSFAASLIAQARK